MTLELVGKGKVPVGQYLIGMCYDQQEDAVWTVSNHSGDVKLWTPDLEFVCRLEAGLTNVRDISQISAGLLITDPVRYYHNNTLHVCDRHSGKLKNIVPPLPGTSLEKIIPVDDNTVRLVTGPPRRGTIYEVNIAEGRCILLGDSPFDGHISAGIFVNGRSIYAVKENFQNRHYYAERTKTLSIGQGVIEKMQHNGRNVFAVTRDGRLIVYDNTMKKIEEIRPEVGNRSDFSTEYSIAASTSSVYFAATNSVLQKFTVK